MNIEDVLAGKFEVQIVDVELNKNLVAALISKKSMTDEQIKNVVAYMSSMSDELMMKILKAVAIAIHSKEFLNNEENSNLDKILKFGYYPAEYREELKIGKRILNFSKIHENNKEYLYSLNSSEYSVVQSE